MTNPIDNLNPNNLILDFFDSITGKNSIYEITKCDPGPLIRISDSQCVDNLDINNLAIISHVFTLETAPLFQQDTSPVVQHGAEYSVCSLRGSLCLSLSESSSLFLTLIHEICTLINVIFQNTFGSVIRSTISVCSLIQKSFLFYRNEKKILRIIKQDNTISAFKKGGYLAAASALNHARKTASSLLAWKVSALATAILSVLAIIVFIIGCIFAFNAGGIFSDTSFMSQAAWTLGAGGLAFLLLGLLSIPQSHCSYYRRQAAIDSIHRSLLCLHISEQIRVSSQDSDNLSSVVARNCLSPYSDLLDPQVFPPFIPSEESTRNHPIERQYLHTNSLSDLIASLAIDSRESSIPLPPSLPPPYAELPPAYEEGFRRR
ncbi:inclusion membrane protein GarD [Chlamydia caviae]|uniref:Uncharacterized protein n=1 Tax=Chlamydia caviae (strain ATCC VR-813 / DSM 19441 / 03DC25 / GPIC) TaxID=227941 RepID=Q822Z0_CHLCV|nr:hypothetical protein [Chlamydia caviae]AAP05279.1 hypothetical protein CCA_00536 [Chlamydia caviae GPIC]